MENKQFKKWLKERNAAVATLDVKQFKKFYNKWLLKGVYTHTLPNDERFIEISMYKCAVHITTLPNEIRNKACEWLIAHGYNLEI